MGAMKKLFSLGMVLLLSVVTVCQSKKKQSNTSVSEQKSTIVFEESVVPKYAEGFRVRYIDGMCLLDIQDPQHKEGQSFQYALQRDFDIVN